MCFCFIAIKQMFKKILFYYLMIIHYTHDMIRNILHEAFVSTNNAQITKSIKI